MLAAVASTRWLLAAAALAVAMPRPHAARDPRAVCSEAFYQAAHVSGMGRVYLTVVEDSPPAEMDFSGYGYRHAWTRVDDAAPGAWTRATSWVVTKTDRFALDSRSRGDVSVVAAGATPAEAAWVATIFQRAAEQCR